MSKTLSQKEIDLRLIRLRNVEKMYEDQGIQNENLRKENKALKERINVLEKENRELKDKFKDIEFQLNQMKVIVFGKKKIMEKDEEDRLDKVKRDKDTYNRPTPAISEITNTVIYDIPKRNYLQRVKIFYIEDIPLDLKKIVTKYIVTQEKINGVWVGEIPIPTKNVVFGNNLKMLINTLNVEQRLSYTQIQNLIKLLFNLHISQGEIANILQKESIILSPVYEKLKEKIQLESSQHLDETSWNVAKDKGFAWSMTGGDSKSTVYKLGETYLNTINYAGLI